MSYSIGEVAKKFKIAPSALRYYEKEGLLCDVQRKASGVREFSSEDCQRLLLIDCLKQNGLSIRGISAFVDLIGQGPHTISERRVVLENLFDEAAERIEEMKKNLKKLEYELWRHRQAETLGSFDAVEELPSTSVPKKLRKVQKKLQKIVEPQTEP